MKPANTLTLVTGTAEVFIGANARLVKIIPQGATTGSVTLRAAPSTGTGNAAAFVVSGNQAALPNGVDFTPDGIRFRVGLTVQLSSGGDVFGIIWNADL